MRHDAAAAAAGGGGGGRGMRHMPQQAAQPIAVRRVSDAWVPQLDKGGGGCPGMHWKGGR